MKLTIEQWHLVLLIIGREYNRVNDKYKQLRDSKESDWNEDVDLLMARQQAEVLREIYTSLMQQEI